MTGWTRLWIVTATLAVFPACGEDGRTSTGASSGGGADEGAGGATTTGSTTSGETTTTASTATTASTVGATTSAVSSSTGGEPCIPLKNADAANPTPGHCEGSDAVTCGQDGWIVVEPCGAGTECREYELSEWRFNGLIDPPVWQPARTVDWAGCLPIGAESCDRTWNGNYYTWVEPPRCDGVAKVECMGMPAPDLYSHIPQLQYGGDVGFLSVVDCPSGEKCAGSNTLDELTCIDADTPACDGAEPRCVGDAIEDCVGTWESLPGYKVLSPCAAGLACYEGTAGPFCRQPGEVPCDDATFAPACTPDAASIVTCHQGFTDRESCATCFDASQQVVPCRCDDLATVTGWGGGISGLTCNETHALACVPAAAPDCNPDVDSDSCVGSVAHRCVGHWEDVDCGALGLVCDVAAGRAGCRQAGAPPCDPISYSSTCDGDTIVSCCACDRSGVLYGPLPPAPCVTGFEVRTDCTDLGAAYTCDPPSGFDSFGECVYTP